MNQCMSEEVLNFKISGVIPEVARERLTRVLRRARRRAIVRDGYEHWLAIWRRMGCGCTKLHMGTSSYREQEGARQISLPWPIPLRTMVATW